MDGNDLVKRAKSSDAGDREEICWMMSLNRQVGMGPRVPVEALARAGCKDGSYTLREERQNMWALM